MATIFAEQADVTQHPNRNKFDFHKNVYGTYKAGYLYPNLVMRAEPTSSFRIKTQFFMNFMPTAYPLQSPMRVIQHYFAVPMRLLWKDFENWSMGLANDKVPPYVSKSAKEFYTGGLYDHLNLPTTVMSDEPVNLVVRLSKSSLSTAYSNSVTRYFFPIDGAIRSGGNATLDALFNSDPQVVVSTLPEYVFREQYLGSRVPESDNRTVLTGNGWSFPSGISPDHALFGYALPVSGLTVQSGSAIRFNFAPSDGYVPTWGSPILSTPKIAVFASEDEGKVLGDCRLVYAGGTGSCSNPAPSTQNYRQIDYWEISASESELFAGVLNEYKDGTVFIVFCIRVNSGTSTGVNALPPTSILYPADLTEPVEFSDVPGANPYYSAGSEDTDTVRLSALIPRAYEMVYNSFYRNKTGAQPFVVNGETKYNEWLPSVDGGPDEYDYTLHQRNWELDAYTSCLPSPQLGNAPLVGITNINALGDVTYQNEDGSTTVIGRVKDGESAVVTDTNATTLEQSRSLVSLASSGISIADFRQTNALQTFLEQTLRTGLTYYDFIRGHFGKGPKKAELQMPEFLGGTSTPLQINMISNTTAGDVPLGAYAGQANAFGESRHTINCYCDDFTIILGIMCIVPDPAYSQMLPTYWKLDDPLDLYYPEFGELGLQPITYREVCPIQSKLDSVRDGSKKLTDVFGYQRPNHDLVWQADSLHGEFRKSLNRFVVNRRFGTRPELGNEFLTIDPAEVNRSFVVTTAEAGSSDDIAVGQTRHDIVAKRPVHKVVVPSLGR